MFALYTSDITTIYMDSRERFFVNNYFLYGEASAKRCGYTKKEVRAIKEKYKKQGIYMLPVRKMAENKMPAKKGNKNTSNNYSSIAFAIACLDYDDQNALIEFSKHVPEPSVLIDEALTLQTVRVGKALREEEEQGRTLDGTSDVMRDWVNMIQAKKVIDDGKDINVNVNNTVTSLLDELERQDNNDDDVIEFDYDKEQRKQEIKKLRKQGINDLLDEIEGGKDGTR